MEKVLKSSNKVSYLKVLAEMSPERAILPRKIIWEDGRVFDVEKITDIRRGLVKEVGELCMKYYCRINGYYKVICLADDLRWFAI